uniref:Uncharacterized protein n=1 Tax=Arundo donax TaxID=35708 RepID=A0A0A8XVS6_ARUDO
MAEPSMNAEHDKKKRKRAMDRSNQERSKRTNWDPPVLTWPNSTFWDPIFGDLLVEG